MSLWARSRVPRIDDVDVALWKDRTLVRAWCMRRTMFLLPSKDLAVFIRGTARRSEYGLRWALERVGSEKQLEKLLDAVLEILREPHSRNDIARLLKAQDYKVRSQAGGGWGDNRPVPFVEVGGASVSVGLILHALGARNAICSGPNVGNESTYVRADMWLPQWNPKKGRKRAEKRVVAQRRWDAGASRCDGQRGRWVVVVRVVATYHV